MREYQQQIVNAVVSKTNWQGQNTLVETENNITHVIFYGYTIGVINHEKKCAKLDYCGHHTACTTARLNAIKLACDKLNYPIKNVIYSNKKIKELWH